MPTFQLRDGFGLDESLTPASGALAKYVKSVPDFTLARINLAQLAAEDLTSPRVTDVQSGITFSHPIDFGSSGVELTVGAGEDADLAIFVPGGDGALLFNPDPFGDNLEVPSTQRYVSLKLHTKLTAGATASPSDLKFGFNATSDAIFAYYERFTSGTTVLAAVKATIERFAIPADLDDIAAMPEGSLATIESTGVLKFSGTVNLLAVTNPLATVDIPKAGPLSLKEGAAVSVGASYTFTGDYQVRIQRLAGKLFRLGLYRKRGSEYDLTVDADASLTAKLGDNDLFVKLMQAISSDASVDLAQLEAAGLPAAQSKAVQTALKKAVDRSLEIGLSLELSRSSTSDAMFLYEIDLDALEPGTRAMLHTALEGDLSGLVSAGTAPPAGIQLLKSVIATGKQRQYSLKINLLGIYNHLDVAKLIQGSTVAWDGPTGQLVLMDQATASKVQIDTSNLVKDSSKLRKALAENFLITATYRAVAHVVSAPELTGLQSFFLLEQNPSHVRMRDYLLLSAALGLESSPAAIARLPEIDDFGPTTTYAEAGYDAAACRALFFDGAHLLDPALYAAAGRKAIESLVRPGDSDDFRLLLATDDKLFQDLQDIGSIGPQFNQACVAAGISQASVAAVGADYKNIVWLQSAMHNAGEKLQALDLYMQSHPNLDPGNHDFLKLKNQLAGTLKTVVQTASADFGGPWGFASMAWLNKASQRRWLLLNRFVTAAISSPDTP